jgi:hypothetical protein
VPELVAHLLYFVAGTCLGLVGGGLLYAARQNRLEDEQLPTPWEPSALDPDVDVRWHAGRVESRWNPKER